MNPLPKNIFVGAAIGLTLGAVIFVCFQASRGSSRTPANIAANSDVIPPAKGEMTEAERRAVFFQSLPPDLADTLRKSADTHRKLHDTILPIVDFRATPLRDALSWLERASKTLDPSGTGVKFSVNLTPQPAIPGLELPPPPTKLTLRLMNVPLWEALKYVADLAKLNFSVDGDVVYFTPAG